MERIKQLAKATLVQRETRSVSIFVSLFNEAGSESGFRTEAYLNKQGTFQGLRFYAGELKFKASDIDRSLSKQSLEHAFQKEEVLDKNKNPERKRGLEMGR